MEARGEIVAGDGHVFGKVGVDCLIALVGERTVVDRKAFALGLADAARAEFQGRVATVEV